MQYVGNVAEVHLNHEWWCAVPHRRKVKRQIWWLLLRRQQALIQILSCTHLEKHCRVSYRLIYLFINFICLLFTVNQCLQLINDILLIEYLFKCFNHISLNFIKKSNHAKNTDLNGIYSKLLIYIFSWYFYYFNFFWFPRTCCYASNACVWRHAFNWDNHMME